MMMIFKRYSIIFFKTSSLFYRLECILIQWCISVKPTLPYYLYSQDWDDDNSQEKEYKEWLQNETRESKKEPDYLEEYEINYEIKRVPLIYVVRWYLFNISSV